LSRRQAGMGCLRGLRSFAGSVSRRRWQVLAEERTRCAGCSHHTYANLSQLQQWRRRYRLLAASAHGRSSKRRWLRSRHSAVFATSQIPRKPIGGQCSKPIDTLIAPAPPAAVSARRPCSALSSLASCGEELLHEPQSVDITGELCLRDYLRLSQRQAGHGTGSTARTIGSQQILC
jgi:hypothetical protein